MGVAAYMDMPVIVLISMLIFIFIWQNTTGCVAWLYCSEVAVDVVLGFVGFTAYFVIFLLTLTTQFMMESELLRPWGTFWLFGICSLTASLWMHVCVKETKGLTDKEKKELFSGKH